MWHTDGNGYACGGNAKFRLVMIIGSALIANCIGYSSVFLCYKCEYSVIADALASFEEEKNQTPYNLKFLVTQLRKRAAYQW